MKPPAVTQQDMCSALVALYLWTFYIYCLFLLKPSLPLSLLLPPSSQLCHKQHPLYCLPFSGLCMLSPLSRLTWPLLLCYRLTQPPHGQQNGANPSTLRTFLPHSLFFPPSLSPYLQVKASPFNPKIILPSSPPPTISFLLSAPSLTLSFFQCFGNPGNLLAHRDLPSWLHPLSPFSVYCSWPSSLSHQYLC